MTYQEILQQTETLNQQDFLHYLKKLAKIAKKKYRLDIFLQNSETQNIKEIIKNTANSDAILNNSEQKQKIKPVFGILKGEIKMSDDFDDALESFKEYM